MLRFFCVPRLPDHRRDSPRVLNLFCPSKLNYPATFHYLLGDPVSTCWVSAAVFLSLFHSQPDLETAQRTWRWVFVGRFPASLEEMRVAETTLDELWTARLSE